MIMFFKLRKLLRIQHTFICSKTFQGNSSYKIIFERINETSNKSKLYNESFAIFFVLTETHSFKIKITKIDL